MFTRRTFALEMTHRVEDALGLDPGQHKLLESYCGSRLPVAIALYEHQQERRVRLEFVCGPEVELAQDVEELLFRAYTLSRQIHLTFESGRDRALCLQMTYGVIAGIFRELDRAAVTGRESCTRMKYLENACKRTEAYFARASQRRAQLRYLGGMLGGLTVVAGVGALLSVGLDTLPDIDDQAPMFLASLIAGGMGAVLSVLFGMTSGKLKLHTLFANAESGMGPLVAAGALRPLLGGLSGIVAYVLLQAAIVPIDVPEGASGTNFVIALALVAGFSERWARGVLAGTEERLSAPAPAAAPTPKIS
ncbi:hypothetical protein C8N24_0088 [Solirubrobacter pauli]|uniref:Uncharacterized protein n=2 Tax=Solirubrobacter pauli TaxID=166793 RepID=A0A660L5K5_9ACTN|nr:hypothetical protein C8N24_0088 [Solirubrobacter pauli]